MNPDKSRRAAKRPVRWMVAFLVAIALAALALVAVFQLQPDGLLDPPSAPKPPMHNAPK